MSLIHWTSHTLMYLKSHLLTQSITYTITHPHTHLHSYSFIYSFAQSPPTPSVPLDKWLMHSLNIALYLHMYPLIYALNVSFTWAFAYFPHSISSILAYSLLSLSYLFTYPLNNSCYSVAHSLNSLDTYAICYLPLSSIVACFLLEC